MAHLLQAANILVTGGAGTLGHAIAQVRKEQGWTGTLTVYSTDTHKHEKMKRIYPDINFVQGDIRNGITLYNAMAGHQVVIHAAAVKVIPVSESNSIDTFDVNVGGSLNVCDAAIRCNVEHVVGISTDKACHPANAYGATKYMLEKSFQEYSRYGFPTAFHLVRYGNVLESNGSVIEVWKRARANGEKIKITDPNMTRFWLSPRQAVEYVIESLYFQSGEIYIPKMPALSIRALAEYTVGIQDDPADYEIVTVRAGEKMHEELLTLEEVYYARMEEDYFVLSPTTTMRKSGGLAPYCSKDAYRLTRQELEQLLKNE